MRTFVALLLIFTALPIFADEPSKLDSFAFEGIPLSTTVDNFKRQKPTAQYDAQSSETANGLQCYILAETPSSNGAMFYFLDGKLYHVQVLYQAEKINKMGGAVKAYEKVTAAFGQPDDTQSKDSVIKAVWKKNHRCAEFIMTNTKSLISVKDSQVENTLNERRSKGTTLGF
jgi:hypothetical protein